MIQYGSITFDIEKGSLSVQKTNRTQIREYPGKNTADLFDLGKSPTQISCNILAADDNDNFVDRITVESMIHTPVKRELHLLNRGEYYKQVVPDSQFSPQIIGKTKNDTYIIAASFITLDPLPYDIGTGEVIY